MKQRILKLKHELGAAGLAALLLLAAAFAFNSLMVGPLEKRSSMLKQRAARQAPAANEAAAGKVAAVHEYLQKDEATTDWLAKLHGIGVATGVQIKSAAYKGQAASQAAEGRIVRTEIVLPLAGSYGQIRDFLNRSLAEIPVMSLDNMTLKRDGKNEGALQAELRLTLHMVKP